MAENGTASSTIEGLGTDRVFRYSRMQDQEGR